MVPCILKDPMENGEIEPKEFAHLLICTLEVIRHSQIK